MTLETVAGWIILGVIAWFVGATIVAVPLGRWLHNLDQQDPSPNHPAHRAHKTLHHADGRPLDEWEQRKLNQIIQGEQAT